METTYTVRYRLSSSPESLRVSEFNSERNAIELALKLRYGVVRRRTGERAFQCYDISINWAPFNESEARAQLQAYTERLEDFLKYHRSNSIRP